MGRWRIAFLVSAAIAISYLDRQTLPVAVSAIGKDIPLSNEHFSTLQSAFLLAYALMVGGSAPGFARGREVLSVLGREVLHVGPNGSGALIKLINNVVCGIQAASFAEAIALVTASGLDREKSLAVLGGSALASPLIKRMLTAMATEDYTPNFPLKLMSKDIGYAIKEAERNGSRLQTAAPALSVFRHAIDLGLGEQDFSAVVKSVKN